MRIFLSGGTGLVGSHTAERLRRRGHHVVALVRPTSRPDFLESTGAELVAGDIGDSESRLAGAMVGCDVVVHAAAVLYGRLRWPEYRRVNVDATERILRAAGLAGVPRALHVSSVAVYAWRGDRAPIREEDWAAAGTRRSDFYGRSKRAAEEAAWRLHEAGVVKLTTVRPAVVYGERDRLFTPRIDRAARLPFVLLPGGGRSTVPVVYAGNVARGIAAALERDEAVGRAYNLARDAPLTARELLAGYVRGLGRRPPPVVPVPIAALAGLAAVADAALGLVPGLNVPRLRRAVALATRGNPYDSTRAERELGWRAHIPHEEALARTARWFAAERSRSR